MVPILGHMVVSDCLAALAYFASAFYEPAGALHAPVLAWPVPQDIYAWLLLMLVLAGAWLIAEFISVTNRETIVAALQLDSVLSPLTAIIFTGAAGWLIGTGTLQWWFVVPWIASVIDAMTSSWLGINNAAQKPFLSQMGSMQSLRANRVPSGRTSLRRQGTT